MTFIQGPDLRLPRKGKLSASPISPSGWRAYWRLEEAAGDRADSSGSGNTLTEVGGATGNVAGKINNAANFAGVGYLRKIGGLGYNAAAGITFACWTKDTLPASYNFYFGQGSGYNPGFVQVAYKTTIGYFVNNALAEGGTSAAIDNGVAPDGNWHSLIAWWDPADALVRLQVDARTVVAASVATSQPVSNLTFHLGNFGGAGFPTNGPMDEANIWTRVLSTAERAAWYNGGAGIDLSLYL